MSTEFITYTNADIGNSSIAELARQYEHQDMWALQGMSEDLFPFVIKNESSVTVMFWCKAKGIVPSNISDPVFMYAFATWLEDHVHPVFHSLEEAQNWADDHDWVKI